MQFGSNDGFGRVAAHAAVRAVRREADELLYAATRPTLGRVARIGDGRSARALVNSRARCTARRRPAGPSAKRGANDVELSRRTELSRALVDKLDAKREQRAVRPCSVKASGRAVRLNVGVEPNGTAACSVQAEALGDSRRPLHFGSNAALDRVAREVLGVGHCGHAQRALSDGANGRR